MARAPKSKAPLPLWRQTLDAFWQGLMEPSWAKLFICLTVFALTIPGALWLMSPAGMSGRAGDYVPRSGIDAEAFATVNAIRLADEQEDGPQLVVLGSSTVAQAIGDEDALGRAIAAQTRRPWQVRLLTTPLQSPWDQFTLLETALADRTAQSPPLVIAIGMSPLRMNWSEERLRKHETTPRLGLRSAWVDSEMRRLGGPVRPRYGSYWLDNSRFVLLNGTEALARFAIQKPAPRRIDSYAASSQPLAIQKRPRAHMLREYRRNADNADDVLAAYQRLVDHLVASPNVQVVFIEEALSPDFVRASGIEADYAERWRTIDAFVDRSRTEYWPIVAEAALTDRDYYDDLHVIRGGAQEKVRQAFARDFGRYVAKREGL